MRALLLPGMYPLALGLVAQPALDRNYCGFAPNDSIDITHDGIPDLVVQGARSGTDDEPSSSGTCRLYVMNLPGTTMLNTRDDHGYWRTKVCAKGDPVPALSTRPQDDLQIPKELYTDGQVQVAYWGYGHQSALVTVTPGLAAQRYVFRTMHQGTLWHGCFAIHPLPSVNKVTILLKEFVPATSSFVVR